MYTFQLKCKRLFNRSIRLFSFSTLSLVIHAPKPTLTEDIGDGKYLCFREKSESGAIKRVRRHSEFAIPFPVVFSLCRYLRLGSVTVEFVLH